MSNVIGDLLGTGKAAKAAAAAAQQQEAVAQSDQGRQLALLSQTQAQSDNASAAMSAPGVGRAMLGYSRRSAGTLGG